MLNTKVKEEDIFIVKLHVKIKKENIYRYSDT